VFRIEDSGPLAASQADIFVLDNLGYSLNQEESLSSASSSILDPSHPAPLPATKAAGSD
jgi:hypothetical protein